MDIINLLIGLANLWLMVVMIVRQSKFEKEHKEFQNKLLSKDTNV